MIVMCLFNIPVSPIYMNALALYHGKSLPTFVNLSTIEPRHEISNNVVCETSKGSDQTARMRVASRFNIL